MKKLFLYATGVSLLLGSTPMLSIAADAKADQATTVTGCVSTGTDGKSFVLTETPQDATQAATAAKVWTLVSSDGVDLSKYANHKVEVTGASETAKGTMSPDEKPAASVTGPQFKVKSVKDIANTCS